MTGVLERLAAMLSPGAVLRPPEDLSAYEQGWRYGRGRAAAVVRPGSSDEVQAVLRVLAEAQVRVQPMGANTGLVGASNPDPSGEQIVLSFERLNKRIEVDPIDRTVLVDAGVTMSQLAEALEPYGLMWPIDLGADSQIGGMIATNTGGTRLLRYGDVRQNVLGLEVLLADGTRLEALSPLRKNNTGLDWKHLFIGTSGSFGLITRARLELVPKPKQRVAVFCGAPDGELLLELLAHFERELPEFLSAFEVISREALVATLAHGSGIRNPYGQNEVPAYSALVELSSALAASTLDLDQLLEDSFGRWLERGEAAEALEIFLGPPEEWWHIRHQISESLRHEGEMLALDLSVPRSSLPRFGVSVRALVQEHAPFATVADFGHWGDGGAHFNLVWKQEAAPSDPQWKGALQSLLYDLCVKDFGGSYSAEHGIGPHNQSHYDRLTSKDVRRLCAALKETCDPGRRLGTLALS